MLQLAEPSCWLARDSAADALHAVPCAHLVRIRVGVRARARVGVRVRVRVKGER